MENEELIQTIIHKIFEKNNITIKCVDVDGKYKWMDDSEIRKEISLSLKDEKHTKLNFAKESTNVKPKYDIIVFTTKTEHDVFGNSDTPSLEIMEILLNYIREKKLFCICKNDKDKQTVVFKIPEFKTFPELQIKLDLMQ